MHNQLRRHYHLLLLVGCILAGTLAGSFPTITQAATVTPTSVQIQAPDDTDPTNRPGDRQGALLIRALIRATAEVTGLEVPAVVDGLRDGKSLAAIAAAEGKPADAIVQAVVDKTRQRLDRAVAAGRLTQAQADAMLDQVQTTATDLVNDATLGERLEQQQTRHLERDTRRNLIQITADVTGLPLNTVVERVQNGENLTEIAESEGKSGDDIMQAAVDQYRAVVTRLLTATRE